MTRAQEILQKHEGLGSKALKAGAVGYIGYKIARPMIPKLMNTLRPAGKAALLKAREYGITPETVKEFAVTKAQPFLQKYGIDVGLR
jgi:hypothetical protein